MNKKSLGLDQAVKNVSKRLKQLELDALILFDRTGIYHFCGFYFDGAILLLTKKNKPILIIDSMNASLAINLLKKKEIIIVTAQRSKLPVLKDVVKQRKIKKIGFSPESVSVSLYNMLRGALPLIRFYSEKKTVQVSSIIKDIREIKDENEIRLISKAARLTIKLWHDITGKVKPGMTEIDIAGLVDASIHLIGYKNSFTTIAATGRNTAFPHAIPTRCKLKSNDHLLVDFGLVYKGYCSDLTRTLYKGRINRQIGQFRELVLEAQEIAMKMVSPGVKISDVLGAVNEFFISNQVSQYVLHGLGHGVGLDIHEAPFLRDDAKKVFKKGMVLTLEPGLYKTGVGGVRHEDMVLVTEKGCKVLTKW